MGDNINWSEIIKTFVKSQANTEGITQLEEIAFAKEMDYDTPLLAVSYSYFKNLKSMQTKIADETGAVFDDRDLWSMAVELVCKFSNSLKGES